jgi:hypothetical protein
MSVKPVLFSDHLEDRLVLRGIPRNLPERIGVSANGLDGDARQVQDGILVQIAG